ncbi:MAG TPA: MlaE family lipid ABC transporter permease subunit, partial [Alphaproteobacteria bacterium]|nr:MlaE family lipid ABC transporter permease subunit [Alphaproteobacteria bacterium]
MVADQGWLETGGEGDEFVLSAGGNWDVASIGRLDGELKRVSVPAARSVRIDLSRLERLDTAGAWVLYRTARDWSAAGATVRVEGASADQQSLFDAVSRSDKPHEPETGEGTGFLQMIAHVGAASEEVAREGVALLGFFGRIVTTLAGTAVRPWRLRVTPLIYHIEQVGLNALPIVALISFLIGVVMAFQGASQLVRFGAEVFVVNLVAVSVLREIGILLTAIVVAGRSGSAFTAQIGSMKVHEEVDAMQTLGLDPMEVLVLPRLLALVITLPLLAFFSDIMGLLGGGLMSWIVLGISPAAFVERLNDAVGLWSFWVGIIKAPVFGFLIAMVGCYEGLQV